MSLSFKAPLGIAPFWKNAFKNLVIWLSTSPDCASGDNGDNPNPNPYNGSSGLGNLTCIISDGRKGILLSDNTPLGLYKYPLIPPLLSGIICTHVGFKGHISVGSAFLLGLMSTAKALPVKFK